MLSTIKAFFESIAKTMSMFEEKIRNLPTIEILKDKKALKRASNITEQILEITNKYKSVFTKTDRKKYEQLRKKFLRYN